MSRRKQKNPQKIRQLTTEEDDGDLESDDEMHGQDRQKICEEESLLNLDKYYESFSADQLKEKSSDEDKQNDASTNISNGIENSTKSRHLHGETEQEIKHQDNSNIAYYPYISSDYLRTQSVPAFQVWPPVTSATSMGYMSYYPPPYMAPYQGKMATSETFTVSRPSVIVKAPPALKTMPSKVTVSVTSRRTSTLPSQMTSLATEFPPAVSPPATVTTGVVPAPSSSSDMSASLMLNKPKTHICKTCGKAFAKSSTLTSHIRIHTGEKPFCCELCSAKFSRLSTLKYHMMVHKGETKYKCEVCGKHFRHLSHYKDHSRIHSGEKKHHCEICGKQFGRVGHYKDHLRIHTGEKPFNCSICNKAFSQRSGMKYHMHKEHGVSTSKDADQRMTFLHSPGSRMYSLGMDTDEEKEAVARGSPATSASSSSGCDASGSKDDEEDESDDAEEEENCHGDDDENDVKQEVSNEEIDEDTQRCSGEENDTEKRSNQESSRDNARDNKVSSEKQSLLRKALSEPLPMLGVDTPVSRSKSTARNRDTTVESTETNGDSNSAYFSEEISKDFGDVPLPLPANDAPLVHPVLQEYTTF